VVVSCYVFIPVPILARNFETVDQQRCSSLCHAHRLTHAVIARLRPTLTFIYSTRLSNASTPFLQSARRTPSFTSRLVQSNTTTRGPQLQERFCAWREHVRPQCCFALPHSRPAEQKCSRGTDHHHAICQHLQCHLHDWDAIRHDSPIDNHRGPSPLQRRSMEWRHTFRARDRTILTHRSSGSSRRSCWPLMGNAKRQHVHQPIFCRTILYPRRPAHEYQWQLPVHKPERAEPAVLHHEHSRLYQHHVHFQRRRSQLDEPTLHRWQSQILQIARQPRR
jgi:hypothetical protein